MVTDDLDIEELVGLVLGAGIELEESTKALESMSELVKQGIQEASKGLQQENEEKILQEGLLRHVPIVGSLFNWWSPTSKEGGIRGRSFNITSERKRMKFLLVFFSFSHPSRAGSLHTSP
ncbi:pyridoxal-dependent decarboxylase domain-containing protein 1 isoform X2 [Rhipicephalus sanguineus]|uniref:pyridoxal-dependent decarboxylase domain-containing protein 1 isoform X2 n=1 Tax=Rhipicephalus sanguineus TaxID=34632 RepID=UPI00189564C1|nr:pyridoxal-dependent decarboxylase domain-containing protein 1 isoform X2 [Rhipicephalus sanguineus]